MLTIRRFNGHADYHSCRRISGNGLLHEQTRECSLSRRTALNRPNGVNTSYGYDSLSRLLDVLHKAGTVTLDGAGYTYDNAGNNTAKTNYLNNFTENYTSNSIYQLTQVTQGASTTESYGYDVVGNRLSSLSMSLYAYNSSNQLTSTAAATITSDNNGNTLTKTDSNGTAAYNWDFENRLKSVVLPGAGGTVTFMYDPFGKRIQKSSLNGTTIYLYDIVNMIEELDSNANQVARYAQGPGIDRPLAMNRSGVTSFYQQDAEGSVKSLTNAAGVITDTYAYDSFGNEVTSNGTSGNPFRYTGREFDSETGLYYYRARYYDPSAGRFLSEDPMKFGGGINFYAYANNSPTNLTDPSGLFSIPQSEWNNLQPKPWDFRDIIIFLLQDKNDCSCWLTDGKESSKKDLIHIISWVPIQFHADEPKKGGDTYPDPTSPIFVNPNGPFYSDSLFAIGHTSPGGEPIYQPGTFESRMVILLHELGHKAMPQGFVSDGDLADPPGASEDNTRLVIEKCRNAIALMKYIFHQK